MQLSTYSSLAVRLANTAGPLPEPAAPSPSARRGDGLRTLEDLHVLLAEQPPWRRIATEADLLPLRRLRAELLAIFRDAAEGEETVAVKRLNTLLATARIMPQVSGHDGESWHLHLAEGAQTSAEGYTAAAVLGLAFYVSEHGLTRLGVCRSRPCHNVFIDVSTNRSRRYCSERCATRANVAAYRARRRSRPAAAPDGLHGTNAPPGPEGRRLNDTADSTAPDR
jgi:predicted RNA-binding Zn ribbon-like protein